MSLSDLITAHHRSMAAARASEPVSSTASTAVEVMPRPAVYVHAGQMFASAVGTDVATILGSCVAVCLWDPISGVGGINHFMLPSGRNGAASLRYGDYATEHLLAALARFGAVHGRLQGKIFGGACVLQSFQRAGGELGATNVLVARAHLEAERIPIVGEDVGGVRGRKLLFSTDTGEALVKRL